MAKKSKGFRNLLNEQRALNSFERRLQQGDTSGQVAGIRKSRKGEIKMSDVLETFVQPFRDPASDYEEQKMLFQMAIIAWNLAIMPESERQSKLGQLISQAVKGNDPTAEQDVRSLVEDLIARKLELFPDNQRYIFDFELKDIGDQYHLSVASSLPPTE